MLRDFRPVFLTGITTAGRRLIGVGEHGVILYSDNGGDNWIQAQVPVDATLTSIAFATPEIGWAAGHYGVVLKTTDGGQSWRMQMNGLRVNGLAAAAAAAAAAAPPPANASPAIALATKRAALFTADGPDKPFLSLLVLGPEDVMAFGAYRMAIRTNDGGKTWTDMSLAIYDRLSHDLYDCALVGQDIYLACETGLVFRSTDNGTTFPQVTPPVPATLFGVMGAADGSVIVYGVAGNCLRSTDHGNSWVPVALNTQDNLVASRRLPSGGILLAGESGELYKSSDNGASFTAARNMPQIMISDFEISQDSRIIFAGNGPPLPVSLNTLFQ